MSVTSYTELKTEVQNWINKSSISGSADDFVTFAEAYLGTQLRTSKQMVLATGTVTDNPIDLSSELTRFKRIRSVSISVGGTDVVLSYISRDLMAARYSDDSNGVPAYYTLIGDSMYLDPAPNDTYTWTIMYYQGLVPLASANTNWLLADYPNIYLYASLAEAAVFAKDEKAATAYMALRDRYLGLLKSADLRDRAGGSSRMISEAAVV